VEIWQAYQAGNLKRAEAAQERGSALADALFSCGEFHAVLKATLAERLGIDCGSPRPPGLPLTAEQRVALKKIVAEHGLTAL
jgi:dihydrodipicolinate synthase/N-acetylneuraminate lyase